MNTDKKLSSKKFCVVCTDKLLSKSRKTRGIQVCATCDTETPERREHQVRRLWRQSWQRQFQEPPPIPSIQDDQLLAGPACGMRSRRPDEAYATLDRIVHLEIDENSHADRDVSCELAKLDETNYGVAGMKLPTIFIRFNPDGCKSDDEFLGRIDFLAISLKRFLTEPLNDLNVALLHSNVVFLFYGKGGQKHIAAATAATQIKVLDTIS